MQWRRSVKTRLYKTPSPILLAISVKTKEVKGIEFFTETLPNSGVKGSGANHYPRAPALRCK